MPKTGIRDARTHSEQGKQGVDVGLARGPAGGKAHDGVRRVDLAPRLERSCPAQPLAVGMGEDDELLVGGRVDVEAVAPLGKSAAELHGHADGMAGNAQVEPVGEERVELQAQQAAFCKQGAVLLDEGEEVGEQLRVGNDDGLAEKRTHFCAADVEHVAQTGNVAKRDVGCFRREAVAQARTINEERDAVPMAHAAQAFKLAEAVERAVLSREGNVEHPGSHHVGVGGIGIETCDVVVDVVGADLSVGLREGDDLVPSCLNGTGLVHVDVSRLGGEHSLPRPEDAVNDGGVGLCAAHEKVHGCVWAAARLPDAFARTCGVGVEAVAGCLFHVGLKQALKDLRVRAFHIVAVKV